MKFSQKKTEVDVQHEAVTYCRELCHDQELQTGSVACCHRPHCNVISPSSSSSSSPSSLPPQQQPHPHQFHSHIPTLTQDHLFIITNFNYNQRHFSSLSVLFKLCASANESHGAIGVNYAEEQIMGMTPRPRPFKGNFSPGHPLVLLAVVDPCT